MNTGQIVKSKTTERFTVIPNEVSRNMDLTLEEKGLLVFLLSLPSDWVLYKNKLHEHLNETKGTVDRVFRQLQYKNYILSVKEADAEGKFLGWNHIVYDEPTIIDSAQIRRPLKPNSANVDVGNSECILNTDDNTNTELNTTKKEVVPFEEKYKFFIKRFNELTKKTCRGDDKSRRNLKNRIKDGYTWKDFEKAINNAYNDKHHKDSGYKYLTPEFITRQDKLEMFLNIVIHDKPKHNPLQGTLN